MKSITEYPDQNLKLATIGNGKAVLTSLLPEKSDVVDYAWAPDGKSLAVSLARTNKHPLLIDRIFSQGVRANLFTLGEPVSEKDEMYTWAAVGLKWSPDSRYLAYHLHPNSASLAADGVAMQVLDLDHRGQPIDLGGGLTYPEWLAWSPDSSKLAYIVGYGREATVNKRVYVIDTSSGGKISDYSRQGFVDIDPAWTTTPPFKLLFARGVENIDWEGQLNYRDVLVPGQRIWALSEDGNEKPLTSGSKNTADYAPVISPDGKHLIYLRLTGISNGILCQRSLPDNKETNLVNLTEIGESSFYGSYLPFPFDIYWQNSK